MAPRTGAQILVDILRAQQVDRVFCVPGESYLAVLDALHDATEIQTIVCRQEGGVAMMAEADGKLTGRPGIAFVTRGPGATNATAGLHVAMQDSTPMILFIGQIERASREREAFQELDYRRMLGQLAKLTIEIDSADRIPELLGRAFLTATSGRPGPVVVALPEDMLVETVDVPAVAPVEPVELHPAAAQMTALETLLATAARPLLLIGGSGWDDMARATIQNWADAHDLPVATAFRRQDRFDNTHRCYVGDMGLGTNPDLTAWLDAADLVIALGARLDDLTTNGYTRLDVPRPRQKLVHVFPGVEDLGKVYRTDLSVAAGPRAFAAALAARSVGSPSPAPWRADLERLRASYENWQRPVATPGAVNMSEVIQTIGRALPADTIMTNGAGNFATWVHRFHRFGAPRSQLAPTSGSMGYGLPAAVAAKLRMPERTVVCVAGDGDFQMSMQELGTAVQYGAALICILVDNGIYGTIRMHQEREYPRRVHGTTMVNPDFAALACSYGIFGETVRDTAGFLPALERAIASGGPALIHVLTDPEALTPAASLSAIRKKAEAGG